MQNAERIDVAGYDEFLAKLKELPAKFKQINIYFTGSKEAEGNSWCPDCREAEPLVLKAVQDFAVKNSCFLVVDVGDKTYWKSKENAFRTDDNVKLTEIPTLMRWKSVLRLNGDYCKKPDLLEMFFTESEDEKNAADWEERVKVDKVSPDKQWD